MPDHRLTKCAIDRQLGNEKGQEADNQPDDFGSPAQRTVVTERGLGHKSVSYILQWMETILQEL